jgi:hypothetical protein
MRVKIISGEDSDLRWTGERGVVRQLLSAFNVNFVLVRIDKFEVDIYFADYQLRPLNGIELIKERHEL